MAGPLGDGDLINFGDLPEEVNALLQQGVAAYRRDPVAADLLFRRALAAAPHQLPAYFCLYKIHTYQGNLEEARAIAEACLKEAARQAGLSPAWQDWRPDGISLDGAAGFALYTLKALAFIHLRRNEFFEARSMLDQLSRLDPSGAVGWPVVQALADGLS